MAVITITQRGAHNSVFTSIPKTLSKLQDIEKGSKLKWGINGNLLTIEKVE